MIGNLEGTIGGKRAFISGSTISSFAYHPFDNVETYFNDGSLNPTGQCSYWFTGYVFNNQEPFVIKPIFAQPFLQINFGIPVQVTGYSVLTATNNQLDQYHLEGSNDNVNWQIIAGSTVLPSDNPSTYPKPYQVVWGNL